MKSAQITSLPILLVFCLQACRTTPPLEFVENVNQECVYNNEKTAEERSEIFPFNSAEKVVFVSFSSTNYGVPIVNDTLETSKLKEMVTLSAEQINQLTDVLYNYSYQKYDGVALFRVTGYGCYYPRHAIVFLNKQNTIIGYIEYCFECKGYKSKLPSETIGEFCEGKYDLIANCFKSFGITFFDEKPIENVPKPIND